jgi:hypothetical protein
VHIIGEAWSEELSERLEAVFEFLNFLYIAE